VIVNVDQPLSRTTPGLTLLALWLTLAVTGCGGVVSPSPTPVAEEQATVTVRVLTRNQPQPIHGALVLYGSTGSYTDQGGESMVPVAAGEDATIMVSAAGYQSMSASGIVGNDERWAFYLEALQVELQP
jgi:hypothetical protein